MSSFSPTNGIILSLYHKLDFLSRRCVFNCLTGGDGAVGGGSDELVQRLFAGVTGAEDALFRGVTGFVGLNVAVVIEVNEVLEPCVVRLATDEDEESVGVNGAAVVEADGLEFLVAVECFNNGFWADLDVFELFDFFNKVFFCSWFGFAENPIDFLADAGEVNNRVRRGVAAAINGDGLVFI